MHQLPTAAIIGAGSSGIAAAKALHERGVPFDVLRGLRPRRRQLGLRQPQRNVGRLPRPAHQHVARPDAVLGLPDAAVVPGLPAPHGHRRVLRGLRRSLRLSRQDPLRVRDRARRAARRRRLGPDGRGRRAPPLRHAGRCQRPPLGRALARARVRRQRRHSKASRCTPTTTATTASSKARTSSCSAWATARWTSPSSRATSHARRTSPPGAVRGSSPSTSSAGRSTSSRRATACRCRWRPRSSRSCCA